jgi:hypothetical protein
MQRYLSGGYGRSIAKAPQWPERLYTRDGQLT